MSKLPSRILNDPDLKNSLDSLFSKSSQVSQAIYLLICGFLCLVLISMQVFHIPVYIQARGITRPSSERKNVICPVDGIIMNILTNENQSVSGGDTILLLETGKEKLQKDLLSNELAEVRLWIIDLRLIISGQNDVFSLNTDKYKIELLHYMRRVSNLNLRLDAAETDYNRNKKLYREKFISEKDYEDVLFSYNSILSEKKLIISDWEKQVNNDLENMILRENSLVRQISEIDYFLEKSVLLAHTSGIIMGIRNNYPGKYCSTGEIICNLIPDTNLIAELYIPPKDIGFIYSGQEVRLLLDSYDYKYWGILKGKCLTKSEDIELVDKNALFRVICEIAPEPQLEYRKHKVRPGKGMTLTAQFLVSERNIWQLLRDRTYNLISSEREVDNTSL